MAAAVPFALKAGAAIGGHFLSKALGKPSAPQQAGMTATQQTVDQLGQTATGLRTEGTALRGQGGAQTAEGVGNLGAAADYYRNILGRGRGATEAAIAPERSLALDYYRGAGNRVSRNVSGPQRETLLAELNRQKVGQLADMSGRARAGAATGIAGVGAQQAAAGNATSQLGANLTSQGTYADVNRLYGGQNLFTQGQQVQTRQDAIGKNVGGFIYDIVNSLPWKKGGGGITATDIPFYPRGI